MAAMSSGRKSRPVRSSKKKTGTASMNRHKFEPFSQRIAKLKIDPIRRTQPSDLDPTDEDSVSSSFRTSLEKWKGLNLSENFANFAREAGPLCETLPQILHHEDKLMDLLAKYIEKKDAVSMEPLLDLLARFVQDLGQRFERHFSRSITLVASIAGSHSDFEVIEWSFTCLAYIFKSLSRLLTPDLCPTLAIMTPYLGKKRQKGFVTRFAAESMSYLIRRAGAKYKKDEMPLRKAVSFLFQDIQGTSESPNAGEYADGIMIMFTEAIRGIQGGLHSTGQDIICCMLEVVKEQGQNRPNMAEEIVVGTLTDVIHNTNAETFAPILDVVIENASFIDLQSKSLTMDFKVELLFVVTATRKGSRIRDWRPINEILLKLLDAWVLNPSVVTDVRGLLVTTAVTLQSCPMDQLLPFMRSLMDAVSNGKDPRDFLGFCSLWSRFESDRFESTILPYLQK